MGHKWTLDEIFDDLDAHHHDASENEPDDTYDGEDVEHAINYAREDILERVKDYVWKRREHLSELIKKSTQKDTLKEYHEGALGSLDNLYDSMVDKNFMAELLSKDNDEK
ncbi:MAG: hypothetical protein ABR981_05705 [Candidatus Micrarchaeaceae archaeon]